VPDEFHAAQAVRAPSRPGYWNDADMLVGGLDWNQFVAAHFASMHKHLTVGDARPEQLGQLQAMAAMSQDQLRHLLDAQPQLTESEQRAHLSLWAMLAAPLLAGNDIRSMTASTRDMLTNHDVIAVDQDPKVETAHSLPADPRVLVKALDGGAVAVAFFNSGEAPTTITTDATVAGLPPDTCYTVRDLWSHQETTTGGSIASGALAPHAVALLRITAGCQ
jgi:alpha-galactosidase